MGTISLKKNRNQIQSVDAKLNQNQLGKCNLFQYHNGKVQAYTKKNFEWSSPWHMILTYFLTHNLEVCIGHIYIYVYLFICLFIYLFIYIRIYILFLYLSVYVVTF